MKIDKKINEEKIKDGQFTILVITRRDEQCNVYEEKALVGYLEKDGETEIVIPNYIKRIAPAAFYQCKNLTSIILPDSVEEIDGESFEGCLNLTNIKLSNKLKFIGSWAFSECENLKSITLPDSLTSIGYDVFNKRYIKEINLPSYQVFSVLNNNNNEPLLKVALLSTIKNYYTGKIKYSDEDMIHFKEYIRENKLTIFEYLKNNIELIHIILFELGINFTFNDIDELLKQKLGTEINAMLLKYTNDNRNNTEQKNIESTIDNKFDLGEFDEEKNKEKKLKKGE